MAGEAEALDANAAQRRYWNTVAGPRWVASPGFRERRNQESLALLLARLGLSDGESVLEIGCGTGALTLPLAEAVGEHGRVVAVDISEPMLGAARQRWASAHCATPLCCPGTRKSLRLSPPRSTSRPRAWGDVFRRSSDGLPQYPRRVEARRTPRFRLLGAARGEPALADFL